MVSPPKPVLDEGSLRRFWPDFPVSPAFYEGRLTHPLGEPSPYVPGRAPISTTTLRMSLTRQAANASDAERLALHRAALALIVDGMERAHDEAWDEQMLYGEVEQAYLTLVETFLAVPAVLHDLIALVTWEDYGLTTHAAGFFAKLSRDEAIAARSLLEEDLIELRDAGLDHQAFKAEGLRRTILASHPDLPPDLASPTVAST